MKNQLTIFSMIGHRTTDPMTHHLHDRNHDTKQEQYNVRISIPKMIIREFISGQRERLESLYLEHEQADHREQGIKSSTFHC